MYEHAKPGASPAHVRAPAAGAVVLHRCGNTCGQERALRAVCFILGGECLRLLARNNFRTVQGVSDAGVPGVACLGSGGAEAFAKPFQIVCDR